MSHHNTIIAQMLKLIPRYEFDTLANQYHTGQSFRKALRWSQLVTMTVAQLSGRNSLRDIIDCHVRLLVTGLFKIPIKINPEHAANPARNAA